MYSSYAAFIVPVLFQFRKLSSALPAPPDVLAAGAVVAAGAVGGAVGAGAAQAESRSDAPTTRRRPRVRVTWSKITHVPPFAADDSRTIRVGSSTRSVTTPGSPLMSEHSASTPSWPSCSRGWSIVVNGGL